MDARLADGVALKHIVRHVLGLLETENKVLSQNVAKFEERRAELEAAAAEKKEQAEKRAASLEGLNVVISAKAGDEGKLFGSIGARDIAEAITAAGVEVSKSEVKLPEGTLRELGEYEISIQLHTEVAQVIQLIVESE